MVRRPLLVTAVCVLGAIAALVTAVLFALDALWVVPPTPAQRVLAFTALAITVTALYGMWRMRRWGVAIVAVLFAARIAYGLAGHLAWNLPALAGPTALLVVGLVYVRQMR